MSSGTRSLGSKQTGSKYIPVEFKLSMLKKLEIVFQLLSILFINLIVDIDQRRTSLDINFANTGYLENNIS